MLKSWACQARRRLPRQSDLRTLVSWRGLEVLLAIFIFLYHLVCSFRPATAILRWYSIDDAFFYFETAKNIAMGLGSTFDGISLTNGYHPLWMAILIPIFKLGTVNLILPLRVLIALQGAMTGLMAIFAIRFFSVFALPEVAVVSGVFLALSPTLHRWIAVGGMETGLNALLAMALMHLSTRVLGKSIGSDARNKDFFLLGIVGGLALLARLDNIYLVSMLGIWISLIAARESHPGSWADRERARTAVSSLIMFFIPVAMMLLGYMIWSWIVFETPMPVSGLVKRWWGMVPGNPYGRPATGLRELYIETFASKDRNLVPFSLLYRVLMPLIDKINSLLAKVGLPPLMKSIWVMLTGALIILSDWRRSAKRLKLSLIVPIAIASAIHILYYKLGGYVATRYWYWVLEIILIVIFGALVASAVFGRLGVFRFGRAGTRIVAAVVCGWTMFSFVSYLNNLVPDRNVDPPKYIAVASWLTNRTEDGSIIATNGGGALAYFLEDRALINLDGLVNSYAYYQSLRAGDAAEYLEEVGVDYIIGREEFLLNYQPYKNMLAGRLKESERFGGLVLWTYERSLGLESQDTQLPAAIPDATPACRW